MNVPAAVAQWGRPTAPQLDLETYIGNSWTTLERSTNDCNSLIDPKMHSAPVLYLPADLQEPPEVTGLQNQCGTKVDHLPARIEHLGQTVSVPVHGLLYLPNPYVVPGGRFNEMYGWDSYFIILGLVRSGRVDLARGIVENFFFEIEHYGGILNANRTYYLSRSQPPFLSSMIREICDADAAASNAQESRSWLARAYGYAEHDHALWVGQPHLAGATGLARFYDFGDGPVPEMADDDAYYQNVIRWLLAHPQVHTDYLVDGPSIITASDREKIAAVSCDPGNSTVCAQAHVGSHWLTKEFYKGDRAMRESGFDTSFRFGPFDGSTQNYAPVCLNALLYKYELDLAWMAQELGRNNEAKRWKSEAAARRLAMDKYLWNSTKGMYFDYDYKTGTQSEYSYLTTFYPLWAGAANPEEVRGVRHNLRLFEKSGGLAMSTVNSGVQWDMPYGWAPVIWLAIDGMARNGDTRDATRISRKLIATIRDNYVTDHTLREKCNVVTGSSTVTVAAGYRENVVGFGWTNAVYLKMQQLLQQRH